MSATCWKRASAGSSDRREQPRDLERDLGERSDAHLVAVAPAAELEPRAVLQLKALEDALARVDDPVVGDAVTRIEGALDHAIVGGVGRRGHLADPVGSHGDWQVVPRIGEARSKPADDIGTDDVVRAELDVDLDQDPPAARAAAPDVEEFGPDPGDGAPYDWMLDD